MTISFTSCHSQKEIKNLAGFDVASDSINTFLKSRMDSLNIPGLSIAVVNDSKVVYHETFGFANLEKKIRVTKKQFLKVHQCQNQYLLFL